MHPRLALFAIPLALLASAGAAEIPSAEWQIKTALLAAPETGRDAATVLGYDPSGKVVTLRAGTNNLVCLADDPKQTGFSVACYYKDLEPFMARGRELQTQGKKGGEIIRIREEEVKAGKLKMPERGVLNVTSGKVDDTTGAVTELYTRYVVYIPYATPETTGIPLAPVSPGGPWLMDPGTHRAHIMINPPRPPAADEKKK